MSTPSIDKALHEICGAFVVFIQIALTVDFTRVLHIKMDIAEILSLSCLA